MSPGNGPEQNGFAGSAIPIVGVREFVDIDSQLQLRNLPGTSPSQLLRGKSLAVLSMRLLHVSCIGLVCYRVTNSTIGPFGIQLGRPPYRESIEIATRLDVTRMRGNSGIAHSQETFRNDSGHFKAVEALGSNFSENSPHRVLDPGCPERSKEHHFHLGRHEKEVPPCAMDLAIHGEAVETLDYVPFPGVGLTRETKELRDLRAICNQDRSDLYFRTHEISKTALLRRQVRASAATTNNTRDERTRVPKVNSTISLSRSGFISSSGCMSPLLAPFAKSVWAGTAAQEVQRALWQAKSALLSHPQVRAVLRKILSRMAHFPFAIGIRIMRDEPGHNCQEKP
jgi:hypothetical protein